MMSTSMLNTLSALYCMYLAFSPLTQSASNVISDNGGLKSKKEIEVITVIKELINYISLSPLLIQPTFGVRIVAKSMLVKEKWLSNISSSYPSVVGDQLNSTSIGYEVANIAVFYGNYDEDSKFKTESDQSYITINGLPISSWLTKFSNRRKDHLILVGKKALLLNLWNDKYIAKLSGKWGYAIDSHELMYRAEGNPYYPEFVEEVFLINKPLIGMGMNIKGRFFKLAGFAKLPPYHFFTEEKDKYGMLIQDGSHVRLFHEASLIFNFTYDLQSKGDGDSYGIQLENGTWTGMIGAVYNEGEFDALIFLGAQSIWLEMFDFAGSLSLGELRFLTRKPKTEIQWEAFLHPFTATIWELLMVVIILMVFAVLPFIKLSGLDAVIAAVFLTLRIVMEQTAKLPRGNGAKILCGSWLIFSIILGTAYKSQVMSALTFPYAEKRPQNFGELAAHKEYSPILNRLGGVEVAYFQSNQSQTIVEIAKRLRYEPDPKACISKAFLHPKTICAGWFPFLEYTFAEWASPDLQISPMFISSGGVMPSFLSVGFQRYSSFVRGFTPIVSTFFASGIYGLWEGDVLHIHKIKGVANYRKNPNSPVNEILMSIVENLKDSKSTKPLQVSNLRIVMVVLSIGIGMGATAFALEHMIIKYAKSKNSVKDVRTFVIGSLGQI